MNEEKAFELTLGMLFVFLIMGHVYGNVTVLPLLVIFAAFVGAFYLVRGAIEFFLQKGYTNFWVGVMIFMVLALFFNGLPVITSAMETILGLAGAVLGAGMQIMTSF